MSQHPPRADPAGFSGDAPGVEVVVGEDGTIVDLSFAKAGYRTTHSDDLGRAIVAAYARARALAAEHATADT